METQWNTDIQESEKDMMEITRQNTQWIKTLFYAKEEIRFLKKLFKSDIFKNYSPETNSKLNVLLERLDDLNRQNTDLNLNLHKHQKDIQGMRECEDISCEAFYRDFHNNICMNMESYMENFNRIKHELYTSTDTLLIPPSAKK